MEYPIYIDKYDPNKFIQETDTHIIAKGGDGTLLKAIKMHRDKGKPFFGIGAGTLNFLMNSEESINIKAKYKRFRLIKVKVTRLEYNGNESSYPITETYQAFNDVMIGGDMNSYIYFDVQDKDDIIGKFSGGGVIFSTAQGSTGINKNNYGIISPLSSKQWIVTGDKTTRNIKYTINPKKTVVTAESRTPITVWVDGANNIINNVSKIEISKGDIVTVIFNNYKSFKKKRRI